MPYTETKVICCARRSETLSLSPTYRTAPTFCRLSLFQLRIGMYIAQVAIGGKNERYSLIERSMIRNIIALLETAFCVAGIRL